MVKGIAFPVGNPDGIVEFDDDLPLTMTGLATVPHRVLVEVGMVTPLDIIVPPSNVSVSVSPEQPFVGRAGQLSIDSDGNGDKTYKLTINGATIEQVNNPDFDLIALPVGTYPYSGTVENSAGSASIPAGSLVIRAYVAPTVSIALNDSTPGVDTMLRVTVTASSGAAVDVRSLHSGVETVIQSDTNVYLVPITTGGEYRVTATVDDGYETATAVAVANGIEGVFTPNLSTVGSLIASDPRVSLATGVASAMTVNTTGGVDMVTGQGASIQIFPNRLTVNHRFEAVFQRGANNDSSGIVLNYASPTDFVFAVLNSGAVKIFSVKSGTYTLAATYSAMISGVETNTRRLIFESNGQDVFLMRDNASSLQTPTSGSRTLPAVHTGTFMGLSNRAIVARVNAVSQIEVANSTRFTTTAVSAPTFTGVDQVGRAKTIGGGVYDGAAATLEYRRLEKSLDGTTWSTVQDIPTVPASYTYVSGDATYRFRVAEKMTGVAVQYSVVSAVVATEGVAGPTITSNDANPLTGSMNAASVNYDVTPATYEGRLRPVGDTGTGTVIPAQAGTTINFTMPTEGAYEFSIVPITSGGVRGTRSTNSYYAAIKVGTRGWWRGFNAEKIQHAPFSGDAETLVKAVAGRKWRTLEPLPKMAPDASGQGFPAGAYVHGVMKNASAQGGRGPQAYDNRCINTAGNGLGRYLHAGFDLTKAHTTWPDDCEVGDAYTKQVSIPLMNLSRGQDHRYGTTENLMALQVVAEMPAVLPAVPQLTGHVVSAPTLSKDFITLSRYQTMLDKITARRLTIPSNVPSQALIDSIYNKLMRGNWQYTLLRGGTHDDNAQEPFQPRESGVNTGNYYLFDTWGAAYTLLLSDLVSNDWKRDIFQKALYYGSKADFRGNDARMSAGIGQHHEHAVSLVRRAQGLSYADMADGGPGIQQRGNFFGSYFKWTAEMLPMIEKHSRMDWPIFSRLRPVRSMVTAPSGKQRFMVEWTQNVAQRYGDKDRKQAFGGLEVVNDRTGEALPYDGTEPTENTTRDTVNPTLMGVVGTFTQGGGLQVGDNIYMRIPAAKKPFVGMADWMYASEERVLYGLWTYYNPTPQMSYRTENIPAPWVMLMSGIGEFEKTGPYAPVREYYIATNRPAGTPNNGWRSEYPGPSSKAAPWVNGMWNAHASTLDLVTI